MGIVGAAERKWKKDNSLVLLVYLLICTIAGGNELFLSCLLIRSAIKVVKVKCN